MIIDQQTTRGETDMENQGCLNHMVVLTDEEYTFLVQLFDESSNLSHDIDTEFSNVEDRVGAAINGATYQYQPGEVCSMLCEQVFIQDGYEIVTAKPYSLSPDLYHTKDSHKFVVIAKLAEDRWMVADYDARTNLFSNKVWYTEKHLAAYEYDVWGSNPTKFIYEV